MSLAYDEYLAEHIGNVNRGLNWMLDNLGLSQEEKNAIETAMVSFNHDESKYSTEEYDAYDQYFYGGNRSYKVVQNFNYAWLHHIHQNPHHWQYWVLLEDDPEAGLPYKTLPIPLPYIFEMIADWWSFSWKNGNLFEIFNWYAEHRDKQYINLSSRMILERILEKIWDVLIMQETVRGRDIYEIEGQYRRFWIEQKMDGITLEHSGTKGQKWGVRNGPPYPLDSGKVAEKLHSDAEKKSKKITKDVENAAKRAGGEIHGLENQLKTKESIERKLNKKINEKGMDITEAANSIKDAVRYTIIAPTDKFVKMYYDFKTDMANKGYSETSCDNYFDKFSKGEVKHKAVQSNFTDKDGYEFEVQFHTPESQDAKDKKLPLYNERRTTGISERRAKELEKQMEDLAANIPDPEGVRDILSHGEIKYSDEGLYGIPELKKYPMPNKEHVKSAIKFFNYVDPKYEKELAEAILEKAEEFGLDLKNDITIGDENMFKKYIVADEDKNKNEDRVLTHYGIKGQTWGERRFQYADGSLTPEGRKRYLKDEKMDPSNKKDDKKSDPLFDISKLGKGTYTPPGAPGPDGHVGRTTGSAEPEYDQWEKDLYAEFEKNGTNPANMSDADFKALLIKKGVLKEGAADSLVATMKQKAMKNYKLYSKKDEPEKTETTTAETDSDSDKKSKKGSGESSGSSGRASGGSSGSGAKQAQANDISAVKTNEKPSVDSLEKNIISKIEKLSKLKEGAISLGDILSDDMDGFIAKLSDLIDDDISGLSYADLKELRERLQKQYEDSKKDEKPEGDEKESEEEEKKEK